jgi:hypothetical protein
MYDTSPIRLLDASSSFWHDQCVSIYSQARNVSKSLILSLSVTAFCAFAAFGQISITTYHNDNNRTGVNPNETILSTTNVNVSTFGKVFSRTLDGQVYAQPLYIPQLILPGQGLHNVVYICTENNSVYAYDADNANASTPLWKVNLGSPILATTQGATSGVLPQVGITSTPVIDPTSNTIYVVAETYENSTAVFRLHALDITTGAEKFNGPTVIQGSVPGTGGGSTGGVLAFNTMLHIQRPALTLANGKVYIGFGSVDDMGPFHGWIFAYDATSLLQTAVWCTTPNDTNAGVWQGGAGMAVDANGFLYAFTGNGKFSANTGQAGYGDSIVKLNTASGLAVADYFSPSNTANLAGDDADLGAGGPVLIPGTNFGVGGGKNGTLFLFNENNLGQFNATTDQVAQEWQATFDYLLTGNAGFFAGPLYYNSQLYAWPRRDTLKVFTFNGSTFNTTPTQGAITVPDGYSNEPALAISSNGTTPGTSILWASYSINGQSDGGVYPGMLRAFDASNVTKELWNTTQNQSRDNLGSWAKWSPPTIANGKVYIGTFDSLLVVYGLLNSTGGQLLGSGDSSTNAVNLTSEGVSDWEHWGAEGQNRKSGVTAQLSNYTAIGTGTVSTYNGDARLVSWSDGTPLASSASNPDGLFITGVGQGFSITAPADANSRTLVVHLGGWNSGGTLTAHLSDGSAPDFTDVQALNSVQYDRNYTLTYRAATANQTLTVTWLMTSGTGNVTLSAASLGGVTTLTPSGGSGQSTQVSTAFPAALQATVADAGGNPISGVAVTFTAPSSGASGTFTGSILTTSVQTNTSGIAVAPAFTANTMAGSYTVTASAPGAGSPVTFSLTNTAGAPSVITATAGTPQSTMINTAFVVPLQATVKDASGNPVNGATVLFTAPGSGASGTFVGSATASVQTVSNGIATAPTFTATGQSGSYTVTASVAGVATGANFSLSNSIGAGGVLIGSGDSLTPAVNLTTEGSTDWEQWGVNAVHGLAFDRKAGVKPQLTNYTLIGSGNVSTYSPDSRLISWSDGTPTASSSNNASGLYINGVGQGYSITAPADGNPRTLVVHVGGWNSGGTFTAHLSDGSAPDYTDVQPTSSVQYDRNYTLTYQAASAGQTLTVTWKMTSGSGNLHWNAVSLH